MQTLDEVIKMLEDALDTTDVDCPMMTLFEGDAIDTLHYLKQFQRIVKILGPIVRKYENIG